VFVDDNKFEIIYKEYKINFEILVELSVLRSPEFKKVVFTKCLSVCVSANKVLARRSYTILIKLCRIVPQGYKF